VLRYYFEVRDELQRLASFGCSDASTIYIYVQDPDLEFVQYSFVSQYADFVLQLPRYRLFQVG
jgi:hypothetical protein